MATVMIGCKLPAGLILEIIKPGELRKPLPVGKRVILKGANSLRENKRASLLSYDYAITPVDKEFWDAWFALNKDLEFVKRNLVFVAPNMKDAEAMRAERREDATLHTGLEPLDMGKKEDGKARDPRLPGPGPMHGEAEADAETLASRIVNRSAA
jgi:hypothetical protein